MGVLGAFKRLVREGFGLKKGVRGLKRGRKRASG